MKKTLRVQTHNGYQSVAPIADRGQEVTCESVVAGCDATKVLEASEHALDRIAVPREPRREGNRPLRAALRRGSGSGWLQASVQTAVFAPVLATVRWRELR